MSLGPQWLAPRAMRDELLGHLGQIARELRTTNSLARALIQGLLEGVTEVPISRADPELRVASQLIGKRDPSDAPFVAVALKGRALGI